MIYTNYKGQKSEPNNKSVIINRSGIWAAIIDSENRILVSHPSYDLDMIELPGGGIENGDSKEISLIREIYEETGVTYDTLSSAQEKTQHVKFWALDKNEFWNYDQEYWVIRQQNTSHYFEGTRPTDEGAIGKWINLSDINKSNFHFIHFEAMSEMGVF